MLRLTGWLLSLAVATSFAQNLNPRPVPPLGVKISAADRTALTADLQKLDAAFATIQTSPLAPDIRIFKAAVQTALTWDEFFRAEDAAKAKDLLRQGLARVEELRAGRATWPTQTGLVVRGYTSKLDQSVQPYGLVVPSSYDPKLPRRWRLDVWLHGRSEMLNEISFLNERQRSAGEFTPPDTIVLHTYGRYNNANKLAGEVDVFEAIDAVKRNYKIDDNRILVRGFSMGGASSWHLGTHHAGLWTAVAPGAGFSETPEYTKIMQDSIKPTWWEQKLWHAFNATDYAANLFNTTVVAYSGEIDKQKQAADKMAEAMSAEGMRLTHIIGPKTEHRYHPDSKVVINSILDPVADRGRDPYPRQIRFTTWTLRYNQMKWVSIEAMDQHWERARLDAEVTSENTLRIKAENVTRFKVDMGPGAALLTPAATIDIVVNGQTVKVPGPMSDRSFTASLARTGNKWALSTNAADVLRKQHGLQGPVDDAFMDSFVFVTPTGTPMNPALGEWTKAESTRAIKEWRRHFRGEAQVRTDAEITDADIASSNLILWGDPSSNKILARILDRLPVKWTTASVSLGAGKGSGATHVPILIYPNPLNPKKYIVLNSGFTWREADYLTNAREVPKLPDWALVDTTTPPDARAPGKIVAAGFFGEFWQVKQ